VSTPVEITGEVGGFVIALAALGTVAAAREWIGFSLSFSLRFIPAAKRAPNPLHMAVNVVPGLADAAQADGTKPLRAAQ